jgi:hypothetical protein
MGIQTGDKAVNVLITATNTQKRDLRFKILVPLEPRVIDSNGIASNGSSVEGVQICNAFGNITGNCAKPEPNLWSGAYSSIPLNFVLNFRGPQDFRGSSAHVSFNVLLGTEKEDGSIKTTMIPVVLPNVPLNPDAPVRQALASRAYEGIRFDVMSARAGDKAVNVLIAATNTQERDLKFKILVPPDSKVIDSNGIASNGFNVEGVQICNAYGNITGNCAKPEPNLWSETYSGIPLNFVLNFRGPQDFRGSSVNISFDALLGAEKDDGSIKPTVIHVALPNVPLSQ